MNAFSPGMLLQAGGPLVVFLLLCLVVALVIIVERVRYLRLLASDATTFWSEIQPELHEHKYEWILQKTAQPHTPARFLVQQLLLFHTGWKGGSFDAWREFFDETTARSLQEQRPLMERFLAVLATLGSVSPFLGLLGTVFGIIRSFMNLGQASMADLNTGIAEALVATAAGLLVAIPSTASYNFLRRRIDLLEGELEVVAARLKEILWKQQA